MRKVLSLVLALLMVGMVGCDTQPVQELVQEPVQDPVQDLKKDPALCQYPPPLRV